MATTNRSATRRCNRTPIERSATIELVPGPAEADSHPGRIEARVIDLGRLGMGVLLPESLAPGLLVRITVEENRAGYHRVWRWHGRSIYTRPWRDGYRVGIEFTAPEVGPGDAIRWVQGGRARLVRLDPAWSDEAATEPEIEAEVAAPRPGRRTWLIGLAVALAAIATDQASKAWLSRDAASGLVSTEILPGLKVVPSISKIGAPGTIRGGGDIDLALAIGALTLLGSAMRRTDRDGEPGHPAATMGWSLILAGLIGNLIDQVALGSVRGVLEIATWTWSLADLTAIAGALILVGLALIEPFRPKVAAVPA